MNWYIGQDIVCIKTHSQGFVKKDKVYTIRGLGQCDYCGLIDIDLGIKALHGSTRCICGRITDSRDIAWISERLFAPLEYNEAAIAELMEETSKETIEN